MNEQPLLFSPLTVGNLTLKNRIFSTGHQTVMNKNGLPTDRLIAYQTAKAKGGAALIITESSRVHSSSYQPGWVMDSSDDRCLEQLTKLAASIHQYDCKIFGQLGHPGALCNRNLDGIRKEVYSASSMRDFRYKNVARPLSKEMVAEIIEAYACTAERYMRAGFDGVEVMASHGVLPAQFLNPLTNERDDEYGGSTENRMRFIRDVFSAICERTGSDFVVGLRISIDEKEQNGLTQEDTIPACQMLDREGLADYFNVSAGTMLSARAAIHIVPPMNFDLDYLEKDAKSLKSLVSKPVFMAGRINEPQLGENLLQAGVMDLCGMTRAMIADPEMVNKAANGRTEDIIACIGCNQACIGHLHLGEPISCIQNPLTGREVDYKLPAKKTVPKSILVIGGGPAGMKAAVTAAEQGHKVSLHESSAQLGGQAKLAQSLPGREEFGGLITNLERQLILNGVDIHKNSKITAEFVAGTQFDQVILATGATAYVPELDDFENIQAVHADEVVSGDVKVGSNVVIYDWRGDWVGIGLAEKLALSGSKVRLATEENMVSAAVHNYVRDPWVGRCHKLGVEFILNARLYGAQDNVCFFEHTLSEEPIIIEDTDTIILSTGHSPVNGLEKTLKDSGTPYQIIGDCLSPRDAEAAVYDGWKAGLNI